MSERFDPNTGLVQVAGLLVGPSRVVDVLFTLDTGATHTTIRPHILRLAGYDPTKGRPRGLRSVTGADRGRALTVSRLIALVVDRGAFEITAHDPSAAILTDGLLGLDFLRGHVLTLDCARGRVALRRPPRWWPF